jgi:site-specific DNA recombinase
MKRAAVYARFSSEMQAKTATIEDQLRICQRIAEREGLTIVETYIDEEIKGSQFITRPGIQRLLNDAHRDRFDVVIAEALDRISRDQERTAHIYKRLTYEGKRMLTLSEGWVTKIHIAFSGAMNEMYSDELSKKVWRGQEGRFLKGKAPGGISYGYLPVLRAKGDRQIDPDTAPILRRIFEEYASGISPTAIAFALNAEGMPSPRGGDWSPSTLNGNRKRGTGILNNELYVGIMVWNRQKFKREPTTEMRIPRFNDDAEVQRVAVEHLRVIDQDLWDRVKARQAKLDRKKHPSEMRRPKRLFSFLLKCGKCGGGMSIISHERYGCSNSRKKGTCDNRLTVKEAEIERRVFEALQHQLMDKELCEHFCRTYIAHLNEARKAQDASRSDHEAELARIERSTAKIIQAIKDGVPGAMLRDEAAQLERRKEELRRLLASAEVAPSFVHPAMAHRYAVQIQKLIGSLTDAAFKGQGAQVLAQLVDKIVCTPENGDMTIDLMGNIAGIMQMADSKSPGKSVNLASLSPEQAAEIEQIKKVVNATNENCPPHGGNGQEKVVAGVGFEPTTFRL